MNRVCYSMASVLSCYRDSVVQGCRHRGYLQRREHQRRPTRLSSIAVEGGSRKLDQLDSAALLNDLRVPPGNQLEVLFGERSGQHSIRVNERYRICFVWTELGPDQVEIVDYH